MNSRDLLSALASANEALIDLHFHLRSNPHLSDALHGFSLRKSGTGSRIDTYAEAVVDENLSYCWWLEIALENEAWTLEASLLKDSPAGQDVIERFTETSGTTEQALVVAIKAAEEDLVRSGRNFRFA